MIEPTTIKMWRAVRVTPPKVPQTLADCEDGRLAVVRMVNGGEMNLRKVVNGMVSGSDGQLTSTSPSWYIFIRYLDDPQPVAPPVPKTFGELRDGQFFRINPSAEISWKFNQEERMKSLGSGEYVKLYVNSCTPIQFIPDIEMVLEDQPTKD